MLINQFNGGLNTRTDPSLIELNQAIVCNNVDNSAVVLKSAKDANITTTDISKYFYKFNDAWYSSANYRNYLEYRDALYYTEPATRPGKITTSGTSGIGITAPPAEFVFDGGNPVYDESGQQYKGIVPVVSEFSLDDIGISFASVAGGELTAATYDYRLAVSQNGVVLRYKDVSHVRSSTGSTVISMSALGGIKVNVYRKYNDVYYYIGQVALTENKTITDKVLDISSNASFFGITDLSVAFSTVAGGNLTAATYNYRFGYTYNNKVTSYVDKSYTSSGTNSIKLTFENLGGTRVYVYRQYSGTYRYIGAVTLSADNTTFTDNVLDVSANSAFSLTGVTYGVIQYTMTYYDENTGVESPPMEFSSEITVKLGQKVQVTNLPLATDPRVTHRRVYRLGGNLTTMALIKEIADNSTTSFYDYTDDVDATTVLESYNYNSPPATIKYIVEAYGILFAANGKDLVFSMQGFPEYWPTANSINFSSTITGLLPTSNGIIVGTAYKTYLLVGTNEAEFAKLILSEEQGVLSHESMRMVKNTPVWLSSDGVCSVSGGYVEVISKGLLGKLQLTPLDVINYDEVYLVLLADHTLFAFDIRYTANFVTYELGASIEKLGVFDDTLYCVSSTNKLGTLFTGADLTFNYKTGNITEQSHSQTKLYNNVYIRINGTVEFKIYIDSVLVQTANLVGNKVYDVPVPAELQRGSSIQFELSGTGTVYEIEYKLVGRQNGR